LRALDTCHTRGLDLIHHSTLSISEWAIKSMRAGKHVLIEKPLCANAQEAQEIFQVARETDKIALEAFHWRFHPATHEVKGLIEGGEYGRVTRTFARMVTPKNSIPGSDIRWKYKLGGGALMDEVSGSFVQQQDFTDDPLSINTGNQCDLILHRHTRSPPPDSSPTRNPSKSPPPKPDLGPKTPRSTPPWKPNSKSTANKVM